MLKPPSLTLGVEEEYQIINPVTRNLESAIDRILAEDLGPAFKPELHQSIVEAGTGVCQTPADVRAELIGLRRTVMDVVGKHGLTMAAAGTHPFANWQEQEITQLERYIGVKRDMGDLAHRLLIFGMHIHVGIEDREFMIDVMNVARYFLPHILALSTSSPFWIGRSTGLKSYRSTIFRGFPRTGIPTRMQSWHEYEDYIETLVDTGCIPDGSKIWWDVRPHFKYPTLEFRLCDICPRVDEAVCIAAIVQTLVYKLWKMRRDNTTFREYPSMMIEENKWRAMRFGLSGKLIDFGRHEEKPAPELIHEFIDWFLGEAMDELGTRKEIEYAYRILKEGSSADRQLATYERTGDLRAVVDQLITETAEGVLPQAPAFEALDERRAAVRLLDGAPVHGARDGDASAGVPETPERGQWMSATPAAGPSQEQRASAGP
jgi:carboxylate-amine ligase